MHSVEEARVGDTLCAAAEKEHITPFEGFTLPKQTVFAGVYPVNANDYEEVKAVFLALL